MTFSYDAVRYHSYPYFETHPSHLGAIATLFGLEVAPAARARYLEIGCSAGGNLLPLAAEHPEAQFFGIDLAASDIAAAEQLRARLGLGNVTLRHGDLQTLDASLGQFDYVIAHGLYSWVPPPVREALLDVCSTLLAPTGIALISHNTKPGYYARRVARDLMLFAGRGLQDPGSRTARARNVLNLVAAHADGKEGSYRQMLGEQVTMVQGFPDWYLFHDYLSDHYFAEYFYEFVERIEQRGLQFLSDARFASMFPDRLSEEAKRKLDELAGDLIEYEQYRDFLTNRSFRFTAVCRQGQPLDRQVAAARLGSLYVGSRLRPAGEVDLTGAVPAVFSTPTGVRSEIVEPLDKAAMLALSEAWPGYLSVPALAARVKELAQSSDPVEALAAALQPMLLGLYSHDVIALRSAPPRVATQIPERPRTSDLVRAQCEATMLVTNLHHELYNLRGKEREVLRLLDGTRTVAEVQERLGLDAAELKQIVQAFLRAALFVAE